MSDQYDLLDYGLAREIIKDLPKLREILENTRNSLENYRKYRDAAKIVDFIQDAIINLDLEYTVYENVVKSKGKVNG